MAERLSGSGDMDLDGGIPVSQSLETAGVSSSVSPPLDEGDLRSSETPESESYPVREGEPDCIYYIRTGLCRFGASCRYNHPPNRSLATTTAKIRGEYPERPGQPECQFYRVTGTCKFGATCKFHHPRDMAGPVSLNVLGYPLRPKEPECGFYLRTGHCRFGITCKFHHRQPYSGSPLHPTVQSPSIPGHHSYPGGILNSSSRASSVPSPLWHALPMFAMMPAHDVVLIPEWKADSGSLGYSSFQRKHHAALNTQISSFQRKHHAALNTQIYRTSHLNESANEPLSGTYSSYNALPRENVFPKRPESKLTKDYKEMLMITAEDPLNNLPETELKMLLQKGILLNKGKTWFSLNTDGEHCEMISIAECISSTSESPHYICSSEYISRFAVGCYEPHGAKFKAHVRTQFLSPKITYTVNLVFRNKSKSRYIGLKYKLQGELNNSYAFLSDEREDGLLTTELYQFTCDQKTVDLEIWFYTECCPTLLVEAIEFQPLKKVEQEVLIDDNFDLQPILDTETYWEQKLPSDYVDIIKRSKDRVQWETKKDLYFILCKGFLISYGEEWFFLAKDGKKCLMVPARSALEEDRWKWKSEPETRFEEVADCIFDTFGIFCKFSSKMLSPQTTYATYLAYELPDDYKGVDQPPPVQVVDKDSDSKEVDNIFLLTPQTPVISWNEKEEKIFSPSSRPKIKGLPKRRVDGWMEVQVHEFQTRANIKMISTRLKFSSYDMSLKGVIVQGVEFRPV